jgi:hypothetical protein
LGFILIEEYRFFCKFGARRGGSGTGRGRLPRPPRLGGVGSHVYSSRRGRVTHDPVPIRPVTIPTHMSHARHMSNISVQINPNLETGGNGCAIGCNWGVNRAFWKFGGGIEKVVIVEGGKV